MTDIWFIDINKKTFSCNDIIDKWIKAKKKPELIVVDKWTMNVKCLKRLNSLNIPVKGATYKKL